MLPPDVVGPLGASGHHAVTPTDLGAHNLPDEALTTIAAEDGLVIVAENAADFAHVTTCPVLFVLKGWWPSGSLTQRLAASLDRWAQANPDPGPWPHWLTADLR